MISRIFFLLCLTAPCKAESTQSIHKLKAKNLHGEEVAFSSFKGSTLLIVNIASQCGYTPQLKDLQTLHDKYKDQKFEVLAFPSDDFHQEPLSGKKIEEFCKFNYGASFKIFKKSKITGSKKNSIYHFLTENSNQKSVQWNFEKFLINEKGEVHKHYSSSVKPLSRALTQDIESILPSQHDHGTHTHDHKHPH